jgi:four helix bundle protein
MFDFEKLDVYQEIRTLNTSILKFIFSDTIKDLYIKDQWKQATMSIMLNLAEGTGRISPSEKKHFYTIARSSVFESAAILNCIKDMGLIGNENFEVYYNGYEKVSKMLLGMYRNVT